VAAEIAVMDSEVEGGREEAWERSAGDSRLKYPECREASLAVAHLPDSEEMLDPMPLSAERLRLDCRERVLSSVGTGSTAGSLKTFPRASFD
jgi:hypothetical protein